METLSNVLSSKKWDLPTREPTLSIGLSFIFLAYFLHPRIESAYQQVRASRAWRAVQKHERVDVTDYPMLKEAFGVRGRWDAARTVTVLLAAFSLGSWVLELSLDIYNVKGEAFLLTQPPSVYKYIQDSENQDLTWQVRVLLVLYIWIICRACFLFRLFCPLVEFCLVMDQARFVVYAEMNVLVVWSVVHLFRFYQQGKVPTLTNDSTEKNTAIEVVFMCIAQDTPTVRAQIARFSPMTPYSSTLHAAGTVTLSRLTAASICGGAGAVPGRNRPEVRRELAEPGQHGRQPG